MDPVTQGVVGAGLAQAFSKKQHLAWAGLWGALGGMAADLDVFIRSTHDPLLALEFHRHFTHSLAFIPFGGFFCALIFYHLVGKRRNQAFSLIWLSATLGYATHGLLDVCTSYGTQLLWPFSRVRLSIDIVSVVDPLVTLPAMCAVIFAAIKKSRSGGYVAILWLAGYLSLGAVQHHRALNLGYELAHLRGHHPARVDAKPSFANILVWKTVYEADGYFFVDAVRPGITGSHVHWQGEQVAKFDLERDMPWLDPASEQAQDIDRFKWFSDGYIALDKNNPNRIVDMRYSLLPNEIEALWGIELDKTAPQDAHAKFESNHKRSKEAFAALWGMVWWSKGGDQLKGFRHEN